MDVVYPYKYPGFIEELRYSLRSVQAHLPDLGEVWIIGERPPGLDVSSYRFIPHHSAPERAPVWQQSPWPDLARLKAKEQNINEKLAIVSYNDEISEEFLFINDDQYLLQPLTTAQLRQAWIRGDADEPSYAGQLQEHYRGAPYRTVLTDTLGELRRLKRSVKDFEAHVPVVLRRSRCRALLAPLAAGEPVFSWTWLSLYFNTFPPDTPQMIWLSHALKMRLAPAAPTHKLEVRGARSQDWIDQQITPDTRYLNHNWSGFKQDYIHTLQRRFPDPSRFERTVADGIPQLPSMPALDDTVHLFWTGGFDSTFRLLQLLESGRAVVPIYIAAAIDGRKNQPRELATMQQLTARIRQTVANGPALQDVVVVDALPENRWVEDTARWLRCGPSHQLLLGKQYIGLCSFAETHHDPIEIGIEIGGRAEKILRGRVKGVGGGCRIDPTRLASRIEQGLMIFHRLRFPLLHLDREAMIAEAEEKGFMPILAETFSCWFPTEGGAACGRCWMCAGRPKGLTE